MEEFEIIFYETADGKCPVTDFINSLSSKMLKGNSLREPYSKSLEDGIFELRCKVGTDITRSLYFFYIDKQIIITNGFVKKTQRTPKSEIDLAKARREDYLKREEDKNENLRRLQERTSKK